MSRFVLVCSATAIWIPNRDVKLLKLKEVKEDNVTYDDDDDTINNKNDTDMDNDGTSNYGEGAENDDVGTRNKIVILIVIMVEAKIALKVS